MNDNERSLYGAELHAKILEGVKVISKNVSCTLGPRGKNVIIKQKDRKPFSTKDGVTVAQNVVLKDQYANLGAQILKQASLETNNEVGDGTTTSIVLAHAIFAEGYKYLISGVYPNEICSGIKKAVQVLSEQIKEASAPLSSLEDIAYVASVSANGDEQIGELIATAIDKVGKNGAIIIEEARSTKTNLKLIEGFRFDSGYISPSFVTDERKSLIKYDNPLFLITDYKIETVDDMLPSLQIAAREGRPFFVVADDIAGQALASLIMNAVRGTMKVAAIKAPRYGEERRNILKDLSIAVGGNFISRESERNLREVKLNDFGSSKSIEVLKNETTIVGGRGSLEEIGKKIDDLKEEIKINSDLKECERIQERITRLASGVAIIRIGASTEIEMIEKKHRFEDALEAVKSAKQEGVVSGGGALLIKLANKLKCKDLNEGEKIGFKIVKNAVKEPLKQMIRNAGSSPEIIVESLLSKKQNIGYDVREEKFIDMIKVGILDPAMVVRVSLENAASVATSLLMTDSAIVLS